MTEKVRVSQEVADALVYLEQAGYDFTAAMEIQISAGWEDYEDENVLPLNNITAEAFAIALLIGYEVELTPYEIIKKEYIKTQAELEAQEVIQGKKKNDIATAQRKSFLEGIEFALNTLDIILKGVNDND